MDELVRKALLGDKKAQEECSQKGILLPCPCCGGTARQHGRFCISYIECDNCGLESCVMDELETDYDSVPFKCTLVYKVRKKWNTRPAPPIGRCNDCATKEKATVNAKGFLICPASGMEITDEDFCSYYESKGN